MYENKKNNKLTIAKTNSLTYFDR